MARLVVAAALAALLVAGCGGSGSKGPPDLAFVSVRDGDYAIFGADADGKHARRLTKEKGDPSSPAGLFFQVEPAWSPDGAQIAFVSGRDGHGHLYVMKADGTGSRRLTNTDQDDTHPTWSPDGKSIVFSREGAIFRVASSGGTATRVGEGKGAAASPAYSPDGTKIAYDYRAPGFSIREVWVMNADGTGARKLTDLREKSGYPAWSPDGKTLAFHSDAFGGHVEIYTMPAAGGEPDRITSSDLDSFQPAWRPDGAAITFSRDGAIWESEQGKDSRLTDPDDNDSAPAWRPVTSK